MSPHPERRVIAALAAAFWMASRCLAIHAAAPELALRVWETDEGLPHNGVNGMIQSSDGFLWLATQSGLARFDGISFVKSRAPLLVGTQTLAVRSIIQEDRESILVANDVSGLLQLREGTIAPHPLAAEIPPGKRPVRLFREEDGIFWIVFGDRELWRCAGGNVEKFPPRERGMEAHWPLSMARAVDGMVYVARGFGVESYADGMLSPVKELPATPTTVAAARDGGVWVATAARLVRFEKAERRVVLEADAWPGDWPPNVMLEDRSGTLWIGTKAQGVFRFEEGRLLPVPSSYPRINSLIEDEEGNLWVGTNGGGLNRIQRARFTALGESEGVLPDTVGSLSQDAAGRLWFGNRNCFGMLENNRLVVPEGGATVPRAVPICHDAEGRLWIASGTRLARWDPATSEPQWLPVNLGTIHVLYRSRDSAMWAAGESGPLLRFRGDAPQAFGPAEGFTGSGAQALAEAPNGDLWAGTAAGELFRMRAGEFQRFGVADGLPRSAIRALHADAEGVLWVGTGGAGLYIGRDGKFAAVTEMHGLPDDTISQVVEDDSGALWMGSSRGLFKARKRALLDCADGRSARVAPVLFGKADGLSGFSAAANYQPSTFKGPNGELWFATRKGLVMAASDRGVQTPRPPRVYMESVRADGVELNRVQPTAGSSVRKLEFHFTAPSFTSPETVRFRYRLLGLDSAWSDAGNERLAVYSRLPPGRYVFEVLAGASDLSWSPAATGFSFEVLPAWWETWWARAGVGVFGIGGIALLVRHWSQRRLKARLAELENRRRIDLERARIARDLHDSLGASLTQAGMLAEELCEDCHDPREIKEQSGRIADRVREIARDLDAAVWAVSPKNDTLDSLCAYLCQFALEFFRHGPTRCRVLMADEIPRIPLSPEVRHHMFLAAREALNNVSKHARAAEVQVSARVADGQFMLQVRDDGLGFHDEPAEGRNRNGLGNMATRMEEIGGRLEVQTSADGTLLTFVLPVSVVRATVSVV